MSDLDLTTMFDDVAASIQPRSNFDAVAPGGAAVVPIASATGGGRPFRRTVAIAAASVMLLGGIAAAAYPNGADDTSAPATNLVIEPAATEEPTPTTTVGADDERRIAPVGQPTPAERTAEGPEPEPEPESETVGAYSAELGEASTDPIAQVVFGTASAGEGVLAETEFGTADAEADADGRWKLVLPLDGAVPGSTVTVRVTFERSDEVFEFAIEIPRTAVTTLPPKAEPDPEPKAEPDPEPKAEPEPAPKPEPEPEPVEFTAVLGKGEPAASPMTQVFSGTATPGSKVLATSAYGHATATAGAKGGWELVLKMYEVPAPSAVRIAVTVNSGGPEFEFWVERPAPEREPEPESVAFTAERGNISFDGELTKVVFYGRGQPGSGVLASSEHGAEDARVGEKGHWEMRLTLRDIPAGHEAVVRVANKASESVYEFVIEQPEAESEPEPIDFTANAALAESDRTPAVNEYWGTSTAGAVIHITSEYASAEVSANGDGLWDARLEFPEAPLDVTFIVRITSSKGEAVYEFPFTRRAPD